MKHKMAFGTWFKNLLVKGKNFIKKASPYIRKGIEIARKVGPMLGGTVGSVINGIANGADMFLDRTLSGSAGDRISGSTKPVSGNPMQPIQPIPLDFSGSNVSAKPLSGSNQLQNIEMIQKPILGGNKGRLNPILK